MSHQLLRERPVAEALGLPGVMPGGIVIAFDRIEPAKAHVGSSVGCVKLNGLEEVFDRRDAVALEVAQCSKRVVRASIPRVALEDGLLLDYRLFEVAIKGRLNDFVSPQTHKNLVSTALPRSACRLNPAKIRLGDQAGMNGSSSRSMSAGVRLSPSFSRSRMRPIASLA
jgi:hypothetical protein